MKMNKHQRAKSKVIKMYIRVARKQGVNLSYKQAKRISRRVTRKFIKPLCNMTRNLTKWGKRFRWETAVAADSMRQFGLTAHTYLVDETPFETRYLGKWNLPKEDTDVVQ
jgi:hypothetical protein